MKHLNILYNKLDFKNGSLYSATDTPSTCRKRTDWLEKGEWLSAAKRIGAEKIFFVENNPVAVFAECGVSLEEKVKAFNQAWCLARPRVLFLASPGEITVYDLAQKPIDINKQKDWKNLKSLAVLNNLAKVSRELQNFHRDNVESGRLFADKRFGDLKNRADKALIRDLKTVRRELIDAGLSGKLKRFAHALIGRSIFIRYLEDRGVLTEEYFLRVARQKAGWTDLLRNHVSRTGFDFSDHETFFPRVLQDKTFTYSLFKKLARDFNGDMFPDVDEEEKVVAQKHLTKIQGLLYGDVGIQKKLFFHSYRFDIIPLDLISSIYEEFYHSSASDAEKKSKARLAGAYYTPPVLAEFVLSRVLTSDVLKKTPRVMDPACGSGIFLVEAFRRIVRYEWLKKKRPLTFDELKGILKKQIAGIEVNEEAARITAFSLYLSMLHHLDPPAIDQQIKIGNRLPNLVATISRSSNHFHCILPGNAFDINKIESNPIWKARFGVKCADVVVGNPPWGAPGTKADAETKARQKILLDWCKSSNKPIGDKELSQAFLWRALDFLKQNGKAGMLVSAGVLFKHNTTTKAFRKQWLDCVRLDEVFNFSHVRKFFFKGGISPFVAVAFKKEKQYDFPVHCWSAKQCIVIKQVQSILLSKNDLRIIRSQNLSDYRTWKLYSYGSYKDGEFLDYLAKSPQTISLEDETLFSCVGFKKASQQKNADWL
ncbi:MAG: N-6 DNA methylase, partial [Thermodesulfobacteriota bacterium]|nr:N-6 DNA methylase [Thermodesulfobacteriota bacterium]